jgi:hypothetical protein
VPICASRPVEHLQQLPSTGTTWSTERATAILKMTEGQSSAGRMTVIDGYPVNRNILNSYGETTLRRAIATLKQAYPDPSRIQNRSSLLRYFLGLEVEAQKKRRAESVAEQLRRPPPAAPPPDQLGSQLLALMREGKHAEAQALAALVSKPSPPPSALPASAPAAPPPPEPSVSEVLDRYLERKGCEKTGTSFYAKKAEQLQRLLGPIRLSELTSAELTLYQRKRRAEKVQEATVQAEVKVLRQALADAVAARLAELDVLQRLWPTDPRDVLGAAAARGSP